MTHGYKAMSAILADYRETRMPVMVWGLPGIGKTEMVAQLNPSRLVTLILSQREPGDVAIMVAHEGRVSRVLDESIASIMDDPDAILFLDEVSCADGPRQAAALEILGSREIAGRPIQAWILAAGNPPECAAFGGDLEPPAANRMPHEPYEGPRAEEWASHIARKYDGLGALALARYIDEHPGELLAFPEDVDERGRAWRSPRSWEMAVKIADVCMSSKRSIPYVTERIIACVGAAGRHAAKYLSTVELPMPEEMLAMRTLPEDWRGDLYHIAVERVFGWAKRNGKMLDAICLLVRSAECPGKVGLCRKAVRLMDVEDRAAVATAFPKLPKDVQHGITDGAWGQAGRAAKGIDA